jgi:hypothetical protein
MFAVLKLSPDAVVVILAVVIGVPLLLNLLAAAAGARGVESPGRGRAAIGCGVTAGMIATLFTSWLLASMVGVLLAVSLIGPGVSFTVSRGVVQSAASREEGST